MFPLLNTLNPLIIILPIVGGVVVLAIIIFLIIFLRKRKKNPKVVDTEWFSALGGQDNILEANAVGSRLSLKLVDKEKIDRDQLKDLGVSSVLVMSNKVTLVIEGQAERICSVINDSLSHKE